MLRPLDSSASSHPALRHDLEYGGLLPAPELRPLLLAEEQLRVANVLAAGGWGYGCDAGLTLVRLLPWDSGHFGFACADLTRIYLAPDAPADQLRELLQRTVDSVRRRNVTLLSARVPTRRAGLTNALLGFGFALVDTSVELGARMPLRVAPPPPGVQVTEGRAGDLQRLQDIAAAFVDNRFHRDPRIPAERARAVYTRWVEAALAGEHGQLLQVALDDAPVGFATYQRGTGPAGVDVFGLVGVEAAHRGRRLLEALLAGCVRRLEGRALVTSTQVYNPAALRGFARAGLLPFSSRHVLHAWLDAP